MFSYYTLIFIILCLFGIYYLYQSKKQYNLPPGPWNLPFIGGLHTTNPHLILQQWAKQYGPLVLTKFGFQDALIIDDPKLMREAFNLHAFNGRPNYKSFTAISGGKRGIVSGDGEEWAEQRSFVLRALRKFGFGKQSMEGLIMEEIHDFLEWMKANEGIPIEIKSHLILATVSTLWTMIAGERQDQNEENLRRAVYKLIRVFDDVGQTKVIWNSFQPLTDILPKIFLKSWYEFIELLQPVLKKQDAAIQKHITDPGDPTQPRDLIDVYLAEVEQTTDTNSSFYGKRGLESLKVVIGDVYGAGVGTMSNLLAWGVLYLIKFLKVQSKFQQELDTVIGPNRLPSLADRPNLPYTEALIMEILRFASQLPLGLLHETTENTKLGGYDIKKGTLVVPNFYSMDHSEKTYGDPYNFRPERFLSPDEQSVIKSEDWLPFSTGKRQCLGETMGRDTLFLFITSIFHQFEIRQDPSKPPPSLDPPPGFFRNPQEFFVIFKERL